MFALLSFQFGFDIKKFVRAFISLPNYFISYLCVYQKLKSNNSHYRLKIYPCFHDNINQVSIIQNEYFIQDLYVANIVKNLPSTLHVDIGSRLDGFVSQCSLVKDLISYDYRQESQLKYGIHFSHVDLLDYDCVYGALNSHHGQRISISCLHTLEHLGLGRYGDKLSLQAFENGLSNLLLSTPVNSSLIISFPVGIPRIYFNAHRIIDIDTVIKYLDNHNFEFVEFSTIIRGEIVSSRDQIDINKHIESIRSVDYALAIFHVFKLKERVNS